MEIKILCNVTNYYEMLYTGCEPQILQNRDYAIILLFLLKQISQEDFIAATEGIVNTKTK